MRINLRYVLIVAIGLILLVFFFQWIRNITEPFQSFSVKLNNKSDYDIVAVETGIVSSSSKHVYDKKVIAGASTKIKPKLQLTGEGAIYLKYTDSRGNTKETVVCGYTESLSGKSEVTIHNDQIDVEQDCM